MSQQSYGDEEILLPKKFQKPRMSKLYIRRGRFYDANYKTVSMWCVDQVFPTLSAEPLRFYILSLSVRPDVDDS